MMIRNDDMKYPWLHDYCEAKPGSIKEFKAEWGATRFMVGNKMFAMHGTDHLAREIVTLKLTPDEGDSLRQAYPDIMPGYYMNKQHWNSVDLQGHVPEALLKTMIDESYRLIFQSLSRKLQKEITDQSVRTASEA